MNRPFVPAFREMSNPTWAIMPAKVIEKFGTSFQAAGLGTKSYGSGPFMVNEFRGTERIILKRHPEYFLAPRPWLDEMRYIKIGRASCRERASSSRVAVESRKTNKHRNQSGKADYTAG